MDGFPHIFHGLNSQEQLLLILAGLGTMALIAGLFGAWIGAYFGGRSGARRAVAAMQRDPIMINPTQLDDLRNSIEAIAVEVERISEGQRFTTRLVAERVGQQGASGQRRDQGSVTPR